MCTLASAQDHSRYKWTEAFVRKSPKCSAWKFRATGSTRLESAWPSRPSPIARASMISACSLAASACCTKNLVVYASSSCVFISGTASSTSSVTTVKRASCATPNAVEMATSAASRPRAITTRPMRGWLWRASKVNHRPSRNTSNQALKSIGAGSRGTPISPR